jgi:hypothetical protein
MVQILPILSNSYKAAPFCTPKRAHDSTLDFGGR